MSRIGSQIGMETPGEIVMKLVPSGTVGCGLQQCCGEFTGGLPRLLQTLYPLLREQQAETAPAAAHSGRIRFNTVARYDPLKPAFKIVEVNPRKREFQLTCRRLHLPEK